MQITLRIPMVRLVPPLQTWLVIGVRGKKEQRGGL